MWLIPNKIDTDASADSSFYLACDLHLLTGNEECFRQNGLHKLPLNGMQRNRGLAVYFQPITQVDLWKVDL